MSINGVESPSASEAEVLDDSRVHPGLRLLAGIGSLAAAGVGIVFGLEFASSPSDAVGDVSAVIAAISAADAAGLGYIAWRGKVPFIHGQSQ